VAGYSAATEDIGEALDISGLPHLLELPDFSSLDRATVSDVLVGFGRFAAEVIAPTDRPGDRDGARLDPSTGQVSTAAGFREAYRRYVEAGWGALQFPPRYGGGGFPSVVGLALQEMFASANMALSLNPVLTQGAAELLLAWGTESQKELWLPPLVRGEWCATMELSEADAGSDLAAVRAQAEPGPGGSWRLSGTKIFITWGEHDLASNIAHLVLARAPGGPPGTRGLSVFLVPKVLPANGAANRVRCLRLEEKLGIHGAPTCVMEYDRAESELIGPLHGGMRAMFTMMNLARLSIGAEGPAVAERSYQEALAYAKERLQGRRPGTRPTERARIIEHPDVARMLLEMRTLALASRLLLYLASASGDIARHSPEAADRERGQGYFDLLTPVAKAWCTDKGFAAASLGVQVHGGAGYIEETGAAQRLRDARIGPIYEGTNGIQAIDLVTRKAPREGGRWVRSLLEEVAATADAAAAEEGLAVTGELLADAHGAFSEATAWLIKRHEECLDDVLAGASAYLELAGVTLGGWLMAKRALSRLSAGAGTSFETAANEANFFAVEAMSQAGALLRKATAGAERLGRAWH
jgi:alkylation response protein AidB-like acyl-CoA dehydrogenase